ncbi:MAG: DUF2510 domain-containing protein [Propionibacteriaceae bacterium]|nr:DUF2510 domain-containing protein [Propionibacteriaceae bacterium]
MSLPGWYQDPEGRPGYARYWDGNNWQGPPVASEPEGSPQPHKPRSPKWPLWAALGAALVAVALLIWIVWGGGTQPTAEDTQTSRPTESVWDEQRSDSPTASSNDDGQGELVPCPTVNDQPATQPDASRLSGGGMSIPLPEGGKPHSRASRLLTDSATLAYHHDGTTWYSFVELGLAPKAEGFTEPDATALQVLDCHLSSGKFPGYESHEYQKSEPVIVSGKQGHWVQIHAVNPRAPGGGGIMNVVVVDTGNPDGLAVFWSGAVDDDPTLQNTFDEIRNGLRLG